MKIVALLAIFLTLNPAITTAHEVGKDELNHTDLVEKIEHSRELISQLEESLLLLAKRVQELEAKTTYRFKNAGTDDIDT